MYVCKHIHTRMGRDTQTPPFAASCSSFPSFCVEILRNEIEFCRYISRSATEKFGTFRNFNSFKIINQFEQSCVCGVHVRACAYVPLIENVILTEFKFQNGPIFWVNDLDIKYIMSTKFCTKKTEWIYGGAIHTHVCMIACMQTHTHTYGTRLDTSLSFFYCT